MTEASKFGAGLVVCLAKFSEHLWNPSAITVINEIRYSQMSEAERAAEADEARRYPKGDASRRLASRCYTDTLNYAPDKAISRAIEMWANGASDHFYDLNRETAPARLRELANLTLKMGHGFTGTVWTAADWDRVRELWRKSCLAIDALLGITADWGQW